MVNSLLLHSSSEIPFVTGRCSLHNPRINEIALIGEVPFQEGIRFLDFSKEKLTIKDKSVLLDKTDFEILLVMMNSKEYSDLKNKSVMVLTLLFPSYNISIDKDKISLVSKEDKGINTWIDDRNYYEFKEIIEKIFVLTSNSSNSSKYNPADGAAERIAEKINKANRKIAKNKGINLENSSLYGKMVSTLAVGLGKDKNVLMNYTVYQLQEEYTRYQRKVAFDINIQARMAGATDLDEAENWQEDIFL